MKCRFTARRRVHLSSLRRLFCERRQLHLDCLSHRCIAYLAFAFPMAGGFGLIMMVSFGRAMNERGLAAILLECLDAIEGQ